MQAWLEVGEQAQRQPAPAWHLDPPVRADDGRAGMTCAAEHNAQGTIAPLQVRDARSHESAAQLPGEQDLVGTGQAGRRAPGPVPNHPYPLPAPPRDPPPSPPL